MLCTLSKLFLIKNKQIIFAKIKLNIFWYFETFSWNIWLSYHGTSLQNITLHLKILFTIKSFWNDLVAVVVIKKSLKNI